MPQLQLSGYSVRVPDPVLINLRHYSVPGLFQMLIHTSGYKEAL